MKQKGMLSVLVLVLHLLCLVSLLAADHLNNYVFDALVNNLNILFGFGYCNLSILTNSDFNYLNALLHHSIHSNTTPLLSMALRQVVMLAKNTINFL